MIPTQTAPAAPRFFQLRCALAYGEPLGVNGVILPYLPVWLDGLAFSEFEIGIVLAAQLLLRVFAAPVAGVFADRLGERTLMLVWSGALSLSTALAMFFSDTFWPVLLIVSLQAAFFAPYAPIVESVAVTGVRRWGFQYGAMRVWGSVGFMAVALIVGELQGYWGFQTIPPAVAVGFVLTVLVAFAVPRLGQAVIRPANAGFNPSSIRRVDLHVLMIGASIAQASHGMFYTFGTIHWQQIGFSSGSIGILWSAAIIFEIVVFLTAGRLAKSVSPWTLLRIGCAAAILRWSLFPFSLGFWGYIALQGLHAFSFAFVHLGLQQRLVESVQEHQESTVQGAYVFYNGVFLAISTILSGFLYRQFGVTSYLAMSLLALIGLATIAFAARIQPQRSGSGG
ncbi:MFS transporter [Neorhizobium huautlense]|uniref:MFS transporter n=1 Tax=Neorhizobium huautlense TaxID=67774 RepID=UPI000CFA6CCF|nr:MFS transporter [Neorhizobium huautlense]